MSIAEGYRASAERAGGAHARLQRLDRVVAALRLVVVIAALAAAWLSLQSQWFPARWLLLPAVLFVVLLFGHERLARRMLRASRLLGYYQAGLARLQRAAGEAAPQPAPPYSPAAPRDHPYAADLNVLGEGSLFERLCVAQTRAGCERLASWLLAPAPLDEIGARQTALAELRERSELREQLSVLLAESEVGESEQDLAAWATAPARFPYRVLRLVLPALALLNVASLSLYLLGRAPSFVPLLVFTVDAALFWLVRPKLRAALSGIERRGRDLEQLERLLQRLEREPASSPWLAERLGALARGGGPAAASGVVPSRVIGRLRRLIDWLEARRNAFFALIGALLWWTTQFACALERWRSRHGAQIRGWLEQIAELEALSSLATWSYENPDHPFPVVVAEGSPALLARELRHPLLPRATAVANDATLDDAVRGYVVSGSNLSGKSTFLRTIGTNLVLALAGAPVCARELRTSPFQVAASLRVEDSLAEGLSRFSAEIGRLRQVLALCDSPRPVLFLLDEVLSGTNSHDRRIGAEGIVRALLERRALGLLTTHDLALAHLADGGLALRNVHFEDHLEDGMMRFDYRLRPGVVTKSNALELMRAVGLPV